MTLTNSRAFDKTSDTNLKLTAVKSTDKTFFVPIDHPCVLGFEPMTLTDRLQANDEYLNAINQNFWDKIPEIDKSKISGTVQVRNDFTKIPASDWAALIKLYSYFCADTSTGSDLEVGGLIICNNDTKELRIAIPTQTVTKASVDWSITGNNITSNKKIFFLDGEELEYDDFKENWHLIGITHSHNTMFTSPSATDDQYEVGTKQKPLPTGIHILCGSFKNFVGPKPSDPTYQYVEPDYEVYASVSHLGERFKIANIGELIDLPSETEYIMNDFEEDILKIITVPKPKPITKYVSPKKTYKSPGTTSFYYPAQRGPSQADKVFQDRLGRLDDIGADLTGIKHLSTARHKSKEASQFVVRSAYDLLDELIEFLYNDLVQEPQEIFEAISNRFDDDVEDGSTVVDITPDVEADMNLPEEFHTNPFFIGDIS